MCEDCESVGELLDEIIVELDAIIEENEEVLREISDMELETELTAAELEFEA